MREKIRGLLAALLCVVLMEFGLAGCAKEQPLYTAGLLRETEAVTKDTETQSGSDSEIVTGEAENVTDTSGSTTFTPDDSSGTASGENIADGLDVSADQDSSSGSGAADASEPAVQTEEAVIGYVYVCGAVKEAGVYPIHEDMRICDAIVLAGGFSADADEEWLNQAANVYDGQKLYVYTIEETALMKEAGMVPEGMSDSTTGGTADAAGDRTDGSSGSSAADGSASESGIDGSGTSDSADGKVNLNTATREELMTLPGIGESKADAILAYRSEHGAFASIEEIQNISGIKSGIFSKIKDLITV